MHALLGRWCCCGTFLSTAEVLHNMPLSIHRHAGYKKNRACDRFQRGAKGEGTMWNIFLLVFHIRLSCPPPGFFFILGGFSFFSTGFHLSTLSRARVTALAVAGTLPVSFTYAWWTVGWSKTQPESLSINIGCSLPRFTPKRGLSETCSIICGSEYSLLSLLLLLCVFRVSHETAAISLAV